MLSMDIKGGTDAVRRFVQAVETFTLAESLGGVESLVAHPATMTHASIPREERINSGLSDGLVRLSVGVENIEDDSKICLRLNVKDNPSDQVDVMLSDLIKDKTYQDTNNEGKINFNFHLS